MLSNLRKDQKGFTIIEVLIMLIVFLAVPALQRNQRNNARNNDASRISASITECLANRNGDKASCNNATELQYGTLSQLSLPTTDFTDNAATALGTGSTTTVVIGYQRNCTPAGDDDQGAGLREFAIMFQVENAINRCLSS